MSGSYTGPSASGGGSAFAANYNSNAGAAGGSSSNAVSTFDAANASAGPENKNVQYACGDCDSKVLLKKGDPIRCKECGHRVLYKERTNRMVQFEAR